MVLTVNEHSADSGIGFFAGTREEADIASPLQAGINIPSIQPLHGIIELFLRTSFPQLVSMR
ncbi:MULTISPECIES: hypothetical protein [Pseudomonas]|uniref:hypothetical protein n=1 Tax=Pseudomonas TaxID=286 RepID=UPI0012FD793E|nr:MULTISPECIES: hypothetical protein [Pseudomonas]MCL8308543.1 hypothetical protein [Pseudomonas putida]